MLKKIQEILDKYLEDKTISDIYAFNYDSGFTEENGTYTHYIHITIYTRIPGLWIGYHGAGYRELQKYLIENLHISEASIEFIEVKGIGGIHEINIGE